jgi:hypothetical protein
MNLGPSFQKILPGIRECESYVCRVSNCRTDCGDFETLLRHMQREHPNVPILTVNAETDREDDNR